MRKCLGGSARNLPVSGAQALQQVFAVPCLGDNVRNLLVSCVQAGEWHRVRIALLGFCKRAQASGVMRPGWRMASGFGLRCWAGCSELSLETCALSSGSVRNLPVSCAQAGAWHRIRVAQLLGCNPLASGKRARALRCHASKLAHGNGSGPRCLGGYSHWSLAKAPASAGAGCQAGRGRRGPLPLLAGLCFCISGWLAADSLQAFRWLQEGKALPSWPPFGGVGARMGAASTRRALGSRFAKRLARSPLFTICRDKATAVSWKMSTQNNTAASMSNVAFGGYVPGALCVAFLHDSVYGSRRDWARTWLSKGLSEHAPRCIWEFFLFTLPWCSGFQNVLHSRLSFHRAYVFLMFSSFAGCVGCLSSAGVPSGFV